MNSKKFPVREISFLAIGELFVGVIISLIYVLVKRFDYTVVTGALLGGTITVLNFLFLSISVNRAVDNLMSNTDFSKEKSSEGAAKDDTGNSENDEENISENVEGENEEKAENDEISKFARENTPKLQSALKLSFILRTFSMVAVLILAALSKQFDLLSTVIPLLMFRPLLTLSEMTKRKEK